MPVINVIVSDLLNYFLLLHKVKYKWDGITLQPPDHVHVGVFI